MTPALFLWIPKTAGSSIRKTLEGVTDTLWLAHEKYEPAATVVSTTHCHAGDMIERGTLPESIFDRFKFAFVRNPWDRLVSLFHYEAKAENRNPKGFQTYIRLVTRGAIDPVGPYNEKGHSKANRQLDWLRWGDRWLPDFVGRFENLESDWRTVCGDLGIDALLPHANASTHDHYSSYYNDALRRRVAVRFAEEIDMFQYTFQKAQS